MEDFDGRRAGGRLMARIRSINPSAPLDEDVATMSALARLVWAYLPCHADRAGRLRDNPFRLKLEILPTDAVDMDSLLSELAQRRHIIRYAASDGRRYIQIRNFHRYQNPHKNEAPSQIPGPEGETSPDRIESALEEYRRARGMVVPAPADPDPSPVPSPKDPPPPAPARDPSGTASGTTLYLDLPSMFAQARAEVVGGNVEWAKPRSSPEKVRDATEAVRGHSKADVEATMRLFWERARSDEKALNDSALAFGSWRSKFGNLLEGVHGQAPKVTPATRAGPLRDHRVGHVRAEDCDHTASGRQEL